MAVAVNIPPPRVEVKSAHVSDSSVQPFLQPEFDPADYLNDALPALSVHSTSRSAHSGQYTRAVPLPELSTQLQTLLSQLNAQTSRLSNTLTQLTDDIVRSGGRLAYEVEVLRGETIGLTDSLEVGLKKDIELFTPSNRKLESEVAAREDEDGYEPSEHAGGSNDANEEPEYLARLRTLTAVRSRLDSVIKVFGEAMQWPTAPSELSIASSLISVSAPDSSDDSRSREGKSKAFAENLRTEINDLIGSGNDISGLDAAATRIEDLRELAKVWKGTAEEKARLKLVESLQKPVEERQKVLERTGAVRKPAPSPSRGVDLRYGNMDPARVGSDGGYGFLQNLRNLKNDMYLE